LFLRAFGEINQILFTSAKLPEEITGVTYDQVHALAKDFDKFSPFVNIFFALCAACSPAFARQCDPQALMSRLNQAGYLLRKMYFFEVNPKNTASDITILSQVLKVKLAYSLLADEEQKSQIFAQAEDSFAKS